MGLHFKTDKLKGLFSHQNTQSEENNVQKTIISYPFDDDGEGETTVLSSSESETTVLSSSEGETTVLSSSEGETTVLSSNEGETTVLSSNEGETTVLSSNEGETTVLSNSDGNEDWESTRVILEDEFSESETTLLSSQDSQFMTEKYKTQPEIHIGMDNLQQELFIIENSSGIKTRVNKNVFMIGKDVQNMDYVVNNNNVSRHHATICYEDGKYYIMDNKSTNGTTIEGVALYPFEKAELYDGSIISLGNVGFQIKIERR